MTDKRFRQKKLTRSLARSLNSKNPNQDTLAETPKALFTFTNTRIFSALCEKVKFIPSAIFYRSVVAESDDKKMGW